MSAFFIKNQLFFNSGEDGENEDKSKNHYFMDEEELKIMAMMNGISTVEKPCGYIEDLK